jgi:hypothetical protein
MVEDVSHLLARHFKPEAVDEVARLISDLFNREQTKPQESAEDATKVKIPGEPGRHRLH